MDSSDLYSFTKLVESGTFTKASKVLGISQPALSQKIAKLEDHLQTTLIIRNPRSIQLTPSGSEFLIYAKSILDQEKEFLGQYNQDGNELKGHLRIASFSSIMRSLIIPKVSKLMKKHPLVDVEFIVAEVVDLIDILKSNRADIVILDYCPQISRIEKRIVGREEYVIIESAKHKNIPDIYFDHGEHDNATETYFNFQGESFKKRRGFMGDVYGIIDGVSLGLGRAVMSKHMVVGDHRFIIKKKKKRYFRDLELCYYKRDYYSPIMMEAFTYLESI